MTPITRIVSLALLSCALTSSPIPVFAANPEVICEAECWQSDGESAWFVRTVREWGRVSGNELIIKLRSTQCQPPYALVHSRLKSSQNFSWETSSENWSRSRGGRWRWHPGQTHHSWHHARGSQSQVEIEFEPVNAANSCRTHDPAAPVRTIGGEVAGG